MHKSLVWLFFFLCYVSFNCTSAQKKEDPATTIILLRHAEKDTSGGSNPPLSRAGIERAKRLPASFPNVVPDEFYSTPYIRTIETIKPWADATGKQIKTYQSGSALNFAEELSKQKGKTIVVVGHSNNIPALVNLLIGSEKYKMLAETEYSNIFVVTIKNGVAKEEIRHF